MTSNEVSADSAEPPVAQPAEGDPTLIPPDIGTFAEGVHVLGGLGNSFTVELGGEVLQTDTGPSPAAADVMIAKLREFTDDPVSTIAYSHGHLGYNGGLQRWLETANPAGQRPLIVAQDGVRHFSQAVARFQELAHLNLWIEFNMPPQGPPLEVVLPDMTFADQMSIAGTERQVTLVSVPSETHDVLAVWVPDVRVLFGSAAVMPSIPNTGEPTVPPSNVETWAASLDRLAAFEAEVLVRGYGPHVTGRDRVHEVLTVTANGLRWIAAETRRWANRGATLHEMLSAELDWPEAFEQPWMADAHGSRALLLRAAWMGYVGWWDRNPTSLVPAKPDEAGRAVLSALTDPNAVLRRARELQDEGKLQLALHVIDLVALAPDSESTLVAEARSLKAELCRARRDDPDVRDCFPVSQAFRASASVLEGAVSFRTGIR